MNRYGLCLVFLVALGGCGTNVVVQGTVPTPLVAKMPVNVGVYYSPDFKSFRHEEVIYQKGTYKVDMGDQNLTFFRNLMSAMFLSAQEVGEPPLAPVQMKGLDGVLVPEIVKYGFLTPSVSGLNFYSASIHYRVTLFDRDGKQVGTWTLVGYGKAEGGAFSGDAALGEATLLAIRDGGARLAIDIPAEPVVVDWLARSSANQQQTAEGGIDPSTGGTE